MKLKIARQPDEFVTEGLLEGLAMEFRKLRQVKFLATSIESGELIALVGSNDRREVNRIAAEMRRSAGVEEVELIRLSEVMKGYLPITSI